MGRHSGAQAYPVTTRTRSPRQYVVTGLASVCAGIGAASFGVSGPTALAQVTVPVISSIEQSAPMDSTIPASLTGTESAASIAALRDASKEAQSFNACEVAPTSTLAAAMIDEPEASIVDPVARESYHISSSFGYRYDPWTRLPSFHLGADFAAASGTPIYAMADGTVTHAGLGIDGRSNNLIIIEHEIDGEKVWTWYVHMWNDGMFVSEGDKVDAGQVIGTVGSNGRSTGPHLHFEVHEGTEGNTVDPVAYLARVGAQDAGELCK